MKRTSWLLVATLCLVGGAALAAPALHALSGPDRALHERLCFRVQDSFDSTRGGFVDRAWPARTGEASEAAIELAFRHAAQPQGQRWLERGLFTLDGTLALEDSVGGGFHPRSGNDPGAELFARSAVLNARRLESLIAAWEATGDTRFWVPAVRVLEFAERNLTDGRGGFHAAPASEGDLIPAVNGAAVHAWLCWWAAARDAKRRDFALRSIDRMWSECWSDTFGFVRVDAFGDIQGWPRLEDQAVMGRALVIAAHLAGRDADREHARQVGDLLIARFTDPRGRGFRGELVTRRGVPRNVPCPSRPNAEACRFLSELAHLTGDARYLDAAARTWRAREAALDRSKADAADWALALDAAIAPAFPARPVQPSRSSQPERRAAPTGPRKRMGAPEVKVGASAER